MTPPAVAAGQGLALEGWWRPRGVSRDVDSRGSALSFGALVAFTVVLILSPQTLFPSLAWLRLALVAAVVAVGSHAWDCFARRVPVFRPTTTKILALGLVAWAAWTVPFSYWPGGSLAVLSNLYLKAVAIFLVLGEAVDSQERLRWLFVVLSAAVVPIAATAIRNYAVGAFIPAGVTARIIGYAAPLTQNPNDLALMVNLVLPLTIALWLGARGAVASGLLAGACALSVVAIVLTFSRGGFLCLACTVVSYLVALVRRGRLGWASAVVGALVAALLFLPSGYSARLATISDVSSDPTMSAQLRWADMVLAARYVFDNPVVGAGIGMNALALNDLRGPAWKEVHNAYLQYGVDLGLPGLALFVGLLLSSLGDAFRVESRCKSREDARDLGRFAEGIRTSLVAFSVGALFHPVAYEFYFFYVGGLAAAARSVCEREVPA